VFHSLPRMLSPFEEGDFERRAVVRVWVLRYRPYEPGLSPPHNFRMLLQFLCCSHNFLHFGVDLAFIF